MVATNAPSPTPNESQTPNLADANSQTQSTPPESFEDWVKTQPQEVQDLLDSHIHGLKNALSVEREARKTAERQLRDLAKAAEAGSESQRQLTQLADDLARSQRQLDFYEEAITQGIKNVKLAYIAAEQDGLITEKGTVQWETLRTHYPELFRSTKPEKIPQSNAGEGTNTNGTPQIISMNDVIRRAAGR